jgi:hypothetical protein
MVMKVSEKYETDSSKALKKVAGREGEIVGTRLDGEKPAEE